MLELVAGLKAAKEEYSAVAGEPWPEPAKASKKNKKKANAGNDGGNGAQKRKGNGEKPTGEASHATCLPSPFLFYPRPSFPFSTADTLGTLQEGGQRRWHQSRRHRHGRCSLNRQEEVRSSSNDGS